MTYGNAMLSDSVYESLDRIERREIAAAAAVAPLRCALAPDHSLSSARRTSPARTGLSSPSANAAGTRSDPKPHEKSGSTTPVHSAGSIA